MKANTWKTILEKVIEKGGLTGTLANSYRHDEQQAIAFLKELSQQFHIQGAINFLGKELIEEVEEFLRSK